MNKKVFDFSAFAVAIIIIAILFSACAGAGGNTNPNNTDNPNNITNEAEAYSDDTTVTRFSLWDCFIAYDPQEEPELVVFEESYGCTPGYLYFYREVYGEVKLLLPVKLKHTSGVFELEDKAYAVTENNEVVKVNKRDGAYETVYKAQYGSIDTYIGQTDSLKYLYFNDGDYIVRMNTSTEEYDIPVHSDKGVAFIDGAGSVYDDGDHFYCSVCGENDNYFIWKDNEDNIYWYHPEKGENEQVEERELYWGRPSSWGSDGADTGKSNFNNESAVNNANTEKIGFGYRDSFVAPDPYDTYTVDYYGSDDCAFGCLYLRKEVYGEIKLLVPKRIKGDERVETKTAVYTIVLDDTYMEGLEVVKADKQSLTYETVYTANYDIHRIVKSADGNYIYFGDGYDLIRLDLSNDKWEVLTQSDESSVMSIRGYLNDSNGPFYCDTCGDEGEHVFWSDYKNEYWYHPKTGENEIIDWETFYETHQAK